MRKLELQVAKKIRVKTKLIWNNRSTSNGKA